MIITRTPFRISFAGGGSDLREYYSKYDASVLSVTINKYVFLSMHPYFNQNGYFLKYSKNELVESVNSIEHKIIRQIFGDYKIKGVDFNSSADIPAGTGLGSSSAFTSGLITLCNAYTSKYMSPKNVAEHACSIEIDKLKEPIGKQDQYSCTFGGMNFIRFFQDDTVGVEKIVMNSKKRLELENNLLMFYLGTTRSARSVLTEQKTNTVKNVDSIKFLKKIVTLSEALKYELQVGNIDALGDVLHSGWNYKKELASQITNETIDYYYDLALKNGATGGKLLGAGGGGFLLFYVVGEKQDAVRAALQDLDELPFEFDNEGTKVIYYDN